MNNESGSTIMPENYPTSQPASPQSAGCSQSSPKRPTLDQIVTTLLPDLIHKASLQDGIMAPSDVTNLADYADRLLDAAKELADDIIQLRQALSDLRHTRQPYL